MLLRIVATGIRLIWIAIEYPYLRRHRVKPSQDWDRHSSKLWDVANAIEPLGLVLGFTGIGRIQTLPNIIGSLGLLLLVTGITIRGVAIHTLGKYFTSIVVIQTDHQLVREGIYRYVRHPAYAGLLLAHLGLGLAFANWFTLGFSSLPYFLVAFYRMRVEEQALTDAFGAEYKAYCQNSKRLIPGLY